jgi:hypothetical protein
MQKITLYAKFVGVCLMSLFTPTEITTRRVNELLAQIKGDQPDPEPTPKP